VGEDLGGHGQVERPGSKKLRAIALMHKTRRQAWAIRGEVQQSTFAREGATVWLGAEALKLADDQEPSERATSFVSAELFDRWRKADSEWRGIERGCQRSHESIIEVPEVEVAGGRAGPVWFTRRANENYAWMSTFMDRPITAPVGGNFLRHFRITINYPEAVAYLEKCD
jgi:hypothetical protein